jgi:hypothetical protein
MNRYGAVKPVYSETLTNWKPAIIGSLFFWSVKHSVVATVALSLMNGNCLTLTKKLQNLRKQLNLKID